MLLLFVITILFCQADFAQSTLTQLRLSERLMKAEFQSLDGSSPIKLSDYRGKIIILAAWASWNGQSLLAVNTLNRLNKDCAHRRVCVIGLTVENPESDEAEVKRFVRDSHFKARLGWLNKELAEDLFGQQVSIPQIFVLMDDGTVFRRYIGYAPHASDKHLRATVKAALNNSLTRQ